MAVPAVRAVHPCVDCFPVRQGMEGDAMSPEAQRIAIARIMDFYVIDQDGGAFSLRHGRDVMRNPWYRTEAEAWEDAPEYLVDLNAMHEAEKALDRIKQDDIGRTQYDVYWQWLRVTAGGDYVGATAAQRAEAFLKTIGKWTTSPSA